MRARGETSCTFSSHTGLGRPGGRPSKKLSEAPRPHSHCTHLRSPRSRPWLSSRPSCRSLGRRRPADRHRPPHRRAHDEPLAIGIAGRGFDGEPDLGQHPHRRLRPLDRRGADDPRALRRSRCRRRCRASRSSSEGSVDPAAIESLGARMAVISPRRGPVIGLSLLVWVGAARAWRSLASRGAWRAGRGPPRRPRVVYCRWCCWPAPRSNRARAPKCCWCCWARRRWPGLTLALLPGYRALAVASALTVLAYADRRDRRLAADVALAARARTPASGFASTGSATSSRRCWRCSSSPAPAPGSPASRRPSAAALRGRLPGSSGSSAPSSSPPAASAPTSAPRSSFPVGAAVAAAIAARRRRRGAARRRGAVRGRWRCWP